MLTIDEILATRANRRAVQLTEYPGRPLFVLEAPGLANAAWVDWTLAQEAAGKVDPPEGEPPIVAIRRQAAEAAEMMTAACLRGFFVDGVATSVEMGGDVLRRLAVSDPVAVVRILTACGTPEPTKVEAVDIPGEAHGG